MRRWSTFGALMICALLVVPARAEDKELEDRVKKLEDALQQPIDSAERTSSTRSLFNTAQIPPERSIK